MKKIVLVAFLGLILAAAQTCPQGQMKINGGCVAITYIPGCASYSAQGICNVCEYGISFLIQDINQSMEFAKPQIGLPPSAVCSLIITESVNNVLLAFILMETHASRL
jgi:hypothetical protein